MKALTLPVMRTQFNERIGKTIIETASGITVFTNGDQTQSQGLLVNIVVNEVGDTFVAGNDSKTLDKENKPLFVKGQTVSRIKTSYDFKSFAGNNRAAEFAQAAAAFGVALNVTM